MFTVIIFLLTIGFIWLYYRLEKEIKRGRVMQSFISGLVRAISAYNGGTDIVCFVKIFD